MSLSIFGASNVFVGLSVTALAVFGCSFCFSVSLPVGFELQESRTSSFFIHGPKPAIAYAQLVLNQMIREGVAGIGHWCLEAMLSGKS